MWGVVEAIQNPMFCGSLVRTNQNLVSKKSGKSQKLYRQSCVGTLEMRDKIHWHWWFYLYSVIIKYRIWFTMSYYVKFISGFILITFYQVYYDINKIFIIKLAMVWLNSTILQAYLVYKECSIYAKLFLPVLVLLLMQRRPCVLSFIMGIMWMKSHSVQCCLAMTS